MRWGKKRIAGVVYDLSHLDTVVLSVSPSTLSAPTFRAKVNFHCHTFTRELTAQDTPDLRFVSGGEVRCFCTTRFGHSQLLPAMFENAAAGGQTYFSNGTNMLVLDSAVAGGPYCAFYKIKRSTKSDCDVVVEVVSAYLKPTLPPRLHGLTFPTVVSTVSGGAVPTKPKNKRPW